jgi:hypothetical protein
MTIDKSITFSEFKTAYLSTLTEFLKCKPEDNFSGLIYGKESARLSDILGEMEDHNSEWVEIIDEGLGNRIPPDCWITV